MGGYALLRPSTLRCMVWLAFLPGELHVCNKDSAFLLLRCPGLNPRRTLADARGPHAGVCGAAGGGRGQVEERERPA